MKKIISIMTALLLACAMLLGCAPKNDIPDGTQSPDALNTSTPQPTATDTPEPSTVEPTEEIAHASGIRAEPQAQPEHDARITARTFGEFDLFVDGKPLSFPRSKSKELLAYLIDRQGGGITRSAAAAVLWEDQPYDRSLQKQLDVIIRSLRMALESVGAQDIFELKNGTMRILTEKLDCDLYRFLGGDPAAVDAYRGEYMNAYSWASFTEAFLDRIKNKKNNF